MKLMTIERKNFCETQHIDRIKLILLSLPILFLNFLSYIVWVCILLCKQDHLIFYYIIVEILAKVSVQKYNNGSILGSNFDYFSSLSEIICFNNGIKILNSDKK